MYYNLYYYIYISFILVPTVKKNMAFVILVKVSSKSNKPNENCKKNHN